MKQKLFKKLILLIIILSGNLFFAQTIKGVVTSNGTTLPGVTVLVEGTKNGTITDIDGAFILNKVDPKATLVFSYVGFKNVSMKAATTMNVVMTSDSQKLDEVVVIGYGTSKRKDVTGAISSIKASDIQDKPFTSIDQALIGKAAGVNVAQNSGTPGGGISVQIRGITSINGNEPLYVIDGTPVFADRNNDTFSFSALGGGNGQVKSSALSNINISDIESIDILKDASATAIYGSNGANGVVLITTKSGKKGKSIIAYETYFGVQEVAKYVDVLDLPQYAQYQTKIHELSGEAIPFQYQSPDLLGGGTNWQKELFRTASVYNHQLSFSGEKEGTRYYSSINYFDQEGIVLNSDFNRLSLRLNVDTKVKSWLKIGNNMSLSKSSQRVVRNDDRGGLVMNTLRQSPELPVRQSDGSFAGPVNNVGTSGNEASNPIALAEFNNATSNRYKVNGNLFADFTFAKGLVFRTELGYDLNFGKNSSFAPAYTLGTVRELLNRSYKQQEQSLFWNVKNYVTYATTLNEKHNFTFLLGQEAQESRYEYLSGFRSGQFLSNKFTNLDIGDATTALNGNGSGRSSMTSYISRLIYGYSDKYSFSASLRADASSNFGPNNKWGYFPSVSGAWTVSNEDFLKNSNTINYLKFRAGYGTVGNQNIPNNRFDTLLNFLASPFGGTNPNVINVGNPDVKWETLKSYNAGVEIGVLNDAIKLDFDYYVKNSSDFLVKEITSAVNQSRPDNYINIGEITTRGVDISLNTRNLTTNNFKWDTSLIFSKYTNELTKFQGDQALLGRVQFDQFTLTRTTEGETVGQFYGYVSDGLIRNAQELADGPTQETGTAVGDVRFKDLDGNGIIDSRDQKSLGSAIPDFTYAMTNNFSYKNINLSVVLQGSQGNEIYNFTRHYTDGIYNGLGDRYSNVSPRVLNAFEVGVNENTDTPRIALSDPNASGRVSDRFVEDGSYLRIQSVTLGYNLPTKLFGTSFFTKAKIYLNVQNLYTFTNYSGFDPALGSLDQSVILNGVDLGRYPVPRISSLGLNLEF